MSEQGLEHSEQYSSNTAKSKLAQRLNRRSSTTTTNDNNDDAVTVTDTDALALADAKNRQQLGEETLRLETSIKQQKQHDKVTQKIKVMLS